MGDTPNRNEESAFASATAQRVHRRFAELTVNEANALTNSAIVIQPVGAVEAHGPHLPLSTDLLLATAAVDRLVERCGDTFDLWALPPLAYTKSNEHAWAPGTIWLSAQTMLSVLDDIARSLTTTKVKKLLFINAHGGNSALLQVACRDIRLAHRLETFLAHPFASTDAGNEMGMSIHGGHDETSMLLDVRPDLVDMTKTVRAVPEHLAANRHVKWGGSVSFGWLSNDFEAPPAPGELPVGLIGDPTGANAEHGAMLWDRVLTSLEEAMLEITNWNPSGC
jgi:creatinine amidohydrolase